jgi:hypothetical protein
MSYKQINLSLPENLRTKAEAYANAYGYKNIQDLAAEALREKIFSEEILSSAELVKVERAIGEKSMSKEDFLAKSKDLI